MASGQERILRRRIRSIQSTKKITRAMELIAASRIVRAQARVHAAGPYADKITEVVQHLGAGGAATASPLLAARPEIRRVALIVIAADRGLCGGYNANVFRAAEGAIRDERDRGRDYALYVVGRKAETYFRYRRYRIDGSFAGFSHQPAYEDARRIATTVEPRFLGGEVDLVRLVYTRFVSAGSQEVVLRPLMPLDPETFDPALARGGKPGGHDAGHDGAAHEGPRATYEFEPSPEEILDQLLPRYAEARLYAALLNAAASEHAARQRAMKAATDNAEDLIVSLTRTMNRARQDAITTEIMEVVGGAEALRQGAEQEEQRV